QASKTLDEIAKSADKLDGTDATVELEADDQATDVLEGATEAVDALDGESAEVTAEADDEASDTLEDVTGAVDDLDGQTATVAAEADDQASDTLDDVHGAVDDLDRQTASVVVEVDDEASGALADVGSELGDIGSTLGALPGPIGGVTSSLTGMATGAAGAVTGVAGAVAAVGAAISDSISYFQDLGIAVGEFVTKTGTSYEDASRLIEVADDLGLGVDAIEAAIGRMNRTAEKTPSKFDAIGASVVRNRDGTLNAKDTFLGVVAALAGIEDAGERADAGFAIFGKGWAGLAPLIGAGADDLRARMDAVSDSKI